MKKLFWVALSILCFSGCASYENYYRLDDQYLARRQIETRRFDTQNEEEMLVASSQVLQDLGYTIDESETKLGLITASKEKELTSTAGQIGLEVLGALAKTNVSYDTREKLYVTVVSTKSADKSGFNVRVGFARIIWDKHNNQRIKRIKNEDVYRNFFDKLSQSLFLTANDL